MKRLWLVAIILLSGCGTSYVNPNTTFFVQSHYNGYYVCVGIEPLCVSKPFTTPSEAERLAIQLNKTMEGSWPR